MSFSMTDRRTRQGKATENEVRKSLIYLSKKWSKMWWMRMFDAKSFYAINSRLQAPRQPSDFIVVVNSRFYALEVKSGSSQRRYQLSNVKEHQKESLLAIDEAGGEGWILLSWRRWKHMPRRNNELYGFRIKTWLKMEAEESKKSVSWQTIIQRGKEFRRKGVWLLEPLFTRMRN